MAASAGALAEAVGVAQPREVAWSHGTNSARELRDALAEGSGVHYVETDLMCSVDPQLSPAAAAPGQGAHAICCHPPERATDLPASCLVEEVAVAAGRGRRIGLKLDVKEEAALPSLLDALCEHLPADAFPQERVPVFLNADVLEGPGTPPQAPLDASRFVSACTESRPAAALSLGWTHGPGLPLGYDAKMVSQMLEVCRAVPTGTHVTLAACATHLWASRRAERSALLDYFLFHPQRSLTLWGPVPRRVRNWVNTLPAERVFVDVADPSWKHVLAVELIHSARSLGCDVRLA